MADTIPPEQRSWLMSRIRSGDTQPEKVVRSTLHRLGFRFSLHAKHLPGRPDVVLRKWKCVVFVHGCFWHRHPGCPVATTPKSRTAFWTEKFERNVARDSSVKARLEALGWRVVTVWGCETKDPLALATRLFAEITAGRPDAPGGDYPEPAPETFLRVAEEVARYGRDLARHRRGHWPDG
ncbi:MAG: very short patch repair endonuclease [Kiritimatiellia bacterium]|jgi:DNA mismatch endonuclease (patch repair protein)